jgi:hypothetical protein
MELQLSRRPRWATSTAQALPVIQQHREQHVQQAAAERRPERAAIRQAQPVVPDAETFIGDETLSVPTTVGGTALAAVPTGARHAYFQNIGAFDVIMRATSAALGGAPDATHGVVIKAGGGFDYTGDPTLLKFLGVGGTSSVFANYFGEQ